MDYNGLVPWRIPRFPDKNVLLYTIPTFQNPTGCTMPRDRRLELLRYCSKNRIPILEDDSLRELWLDEVPPPSLKAMDNEENVIYIGSVSKCFSPGLRVGWIVGSEAIIRRLADVKMQMDYGASSLAQPIVRDHYL